VFSFVPGCQGLWPRADPLLDASSVSTPRYLGESSTSMSSRVRVVQPNTCYRVMKASWMSIGLQTEITCLRRDCGSQALDLHDRLEFQARLRAAWFRGVLFSSLVSGWQIHFGHDTPILEFNAFRHRHAELDKTMRL